MWRQTHFDTPDESTGSSGYPVVSGTPWKAAGKWAWSDGADWYITTDLGPDFWLSGDHATPQQTALTTDFRIHNGRRYFVGGGWAVWYNGTVWVISNGVGVCVAENYYVPTGTVTYNEGTEEYDVFDTTQDPNVLLASFADEGDADEYLADWIEANSYYEGDDWYSGGSTLEAAFVPRGNHRGAHEGFYCGDRYFVTWSIEGHRHLNNGTAPAGNYQEYERTVTIAETVDGSPTHAGCPQNTYAYTEVETTDTPAPEVFIGLGKWTDSEDKEYIEPIIGDPDESRMITFEEYVLGENTTRNTTGVKTYIGQVGLWL